MVEHPFTNEDIRLIRGHGLSIQEAQRQMDLFRMPPPFLNLLRPCTPEDGIKVFDEEDLMALTEAYENNAPKRHCLKFVPASGAASRMFRIPLRYLNRGRPIEKESIATQAQAGQRDAREFLEFLDGLRDFAFFDELKSLMSREGLDMDTLLRKGQFTEIIRLILGDAGLNYAGLPKGLLKFHEYPNGSRTAFEEQLVEGASYIANQDGSCFFHFTVSQEHLGLFQALFERLRSKYEEEHKSTFHVTFSLQKASTDTLAVDLDNKPFRQENGRLLFRPGGHGALIENLTDLKGDIIFLKNIDNVVPDRLKPETFKWKKILGGFLITIQDKIFRYMDKLSSGAADERLIDRVATFMRDELLCPLPAHEAGLPPDEKKALLVQKLNRPVRICGMVSNVGEPGGGPFWVQDQTGEVSLQIVETAQVDPESQQQQAILASSTHFNPVDVVCGVHDWKGRPFDLRQYVDQDAVFLSRKSKDGKDLKALEHPGLWNGSMAKWITMFVEVPSITFNPVKTINDLLRMEHQPEKTC
ncbi:MAG: DUF4301 family protein [Thermodesulfobacteriota bacterium]|nr:DUF4301 family protein [Thermodesulfobacteriota bacterium]